MSYPEILDKLANPKIKAIYGYMYGHPFISTSDGMVKDKIIKIKKSDLIISSKRQTLFYVWGYPGPDYNAYKFSDYGKTWAFTREEISS